MQHQPQGSLVANFITIESPCGSSSCLKTEAEKTLQEQDETMAKAAIAAVGEKFLQSRNIHATTTTTAVQNQEEPIRHLLHTFQKELFDDLFSSIGYHIAVKIFPLSGRP